MAVGCRIPVHPDCMQGSSGVNPLTSLCSCILTGIGAYFTHVHTHSQSTLFVHVWHVSMFVSWRNQTTDVPMVTSYSCASVTETVFNSYFTFRISLVSNVGAQKDKSILLLFFNMQHLSKFMQATGQHYPSAEHSWLFFVGMGWALTTVSYSLHIPRAVSANDGVS